MKTCECKGNVIVINWFPSPHLLIIKDYNIGRLLCHELIKRNHWNCHLSRELLKAAQLIFVPNENACNVLLFFLTSTYCVSPQMNKKLSDPLGGANWLSFLHATTTKLKSCAIIGSMYEGCFYLNCFLFLFFVVWFRKLSLSLKQFMSHEYACYFLLFLARAHSIVYSVTRTVQSVLRMAKLEDILEAFQTNITEEKMKRTWGWATLLLLYVSLLTLGLSPTGGHQSWLGRRAG